MPNINIVVDTTPIYIRYSPVTTPTIGVKFGAVDSVNGQTGVVLVNSVPNGGTTGQVLAKNSNDDNDTEWVNQSGGSITSVVGTANRISVNNTDPENPVLNIDPAYDLLSRNTKTFFRNISEYRHTGTTSETKIFSFLIPAGTLQNLDQLRKLFKYAPSNSVANKTVRLYVNKVDVLPTAGGVQQIAIHTFTSAAGSMIRNMWIDSGNLYQLVRTTSYASDEGSTFNNSTLSAVAFNPAVDNYLIVSGQLADAASSIYFWNAYGLIIRE